MGSFTYDRMDTGVRTRMRVCGRERGGTPGGRRVPVRRPAPNGSAPTPPDAEVSANGGDCKRGARKRRASMAWRGLAASGDGTVVRKTTTRNSVHTGVHGSSDDHTPAGTGHRGHLDVPAGRRLDLRPGQALGAALRLGTRGRTDRGSGTDQVLAQPSARQAAVRTRIRAHRAVRGRGRAVCHGRRPQHQQARRDRLRPPKAGVLGTRMRSGGEARAGRRSCLARLPPGRPGSQACTLCRVKGPMLLARGTRP